MYPNRCKRSIRSVHSVRTGIFWVASPIDVTPYGIGRPIDPGNHGASRREAGKRRKPRFGQSSLAFLIPNRARYDP